MWKLVKSNRGSITIEMCFVMPIVVGVIMMLICLLLKGINEGSSLGTSQIVVYQYSEEYSGSDAADNWDELKDVVMFDKVNGKLNVGENEISATVSSYQDGEAYSIMKVGCKREWNQCTDRLRRWQLYGDVLCE